ncbi:MAG: DUF4202 domain-containing protein [Patescibacteria group bacterium]|nr:DUF4202 domain-containing protein [Patescibacteria group bacterium]
MKYYPRAEKFVIDSFTKAGRIGGLPHLERTVHWLRVLKPDADEAILIAAIAHDIERAFRNPEYEERFKSSKEGFLDSGHMKYHQGEGARIIADFLKTQGADSALVERVKVLVSKHEEGGSDDQNVLKDADSISYFEVNAGKFVKLHLQKVGREKIRKKFDWMFSRITSEKARGIAGPWYEAAVKSLEK